MNAPEAVGYGKETVLKKGEPSERPEPDVPEADVVLGDEERIADLDRAVCVDVALPEPVGAGGGLLLEDEEGVGLVGPIILVRVPEEDWGDFDAVGLCARLPAVHCERDGAVAGEGVGADGVLVGGGCAAALERAGEESGKEEESTGPPGRYRFTLP